MRLGNKVIMLLPDSIVYVGKIESWLHDMAKEGLVLKRMRKNFAVFEKSEPQNTDYYLSAYNEAYMSDERKEIIKSEGWELVGRGIAANRRTIIRNLVDSQNLFYLFRKERAGIEVSMPADEMKADWMDSVISSDKSKKNGNFAMFSLLLAETFFLFRVGINDSIYLFYMSISFALFAGILIIINFLDAKQVKQYKKVYENNKNLRDLRDWQPSAKKNRTKIVIKFICIAYFTYLFIGSLYNDFFPDNSRLVELSDKYITAYDIEGYGHNLSEHQKQMMYDDPDYDFFDDSPHIYTLPNLLTPIYYRVWDYGHVYTDDGEEISIYYNMEYCHPVFGRFNYLFFDSWVEGYSDSGVAAAILDDTDYFIKCAYHKNDNSNITYFCMYSSYEMIYLRYSGGKTPEEVIEAIEYALTNK